MTRLAILTVDDNVWALGAWTKTIPALKAAGYDVAGLWVCPDRLGPWRGADIGRWYAAHFGGWDMFRLGLFRVLARLLRRASGKPPDLAALCKAQGVSYAVACGVDDPRLVDWLRSRKIDVLLIMVADIIKQPLLDAVGTHIINRHDGLLPSNRGLFPNLWARIKGQAQGVTFHVVTEKIDDGRILYQEALGDFSLTGFALDGFGQYHLRILKALAGVGGSGGLPLALQSPSYQGLPSARDIEEFRNQGGAFIRWADFLALYKII